MSRLDHDAMMTAALDGLGAQADESGAADLVFDKGALIIAAEPGDFKAVFKRAKKLEGYRWVMINRGDLLLANPMSLGSKAGIITPEGDVLKAADVPRRKI